MSIEDFFKQINGAKSLCDKIISKQVEVRLVNKDGIILSNHFTLTKACYMFNPCNTDSAFVLEFQIE